ncbi:MAG: GNAT family N-acetyltransferase [Bacilli bacterium]|nr:GNAT family N-acetyltransferase [Bacilli bacterium]
MSDFVIRNLEEPDIPSIVDIQIRAWQTTYKGIIDDAYLNTMNREKIIEKRKKDFKKNSYIVAELNKEVVGFCWYIDDNSFTINASSIDCEIIALYVRTDLKKKGIGTKLFQYAINEFKRKNKTKMIVWCLKDNEPSKKFYRKMGGKIAREKVVEIGEKNYVEVGFEYNIA